MGRLVTGGPHSWKDHAEVVEVPINDSTVGQRNEEKAESHTSHVPNIVLFLRSNSFPPGAFWTGAPFPDRLFSITPLEAPDAYRPEPCTDLDDQGQEGGRTIPYTTIVKTGDDAEEFASLASAPPLGLVPS
ncbi:uncharacterized protein ARMOST_17437 [Armillaria ostoyae]|uniref:Uncharacterized protein n=1 Tax=Armillaria ostoyae TaxID=47428 RepID=A0A284RYZ9_ARMOS|nr:uncharacterized protein ARMOST_17437 [Armillaria ostoyae]